jgi:ribonuclease Z
MPGRLVERRIGSVALVGRSLAGEESVIAAPELNVCFDIGRAPRDVIPIDNICISHGHIDHCANIAYYFSHRGFLGTHPGRLIVHRSLAVHFHKLMDVWAEIEGRPNAAVIEGVGPGEEVRVRRDLLIRAFGVNHERRSLGFSVIEERTKLKPEYGDRTGPQLVELKKQGVPIENRVEVPVIAYCGDTADGDFFDLDWVRNANVLLVECTFFEPDHVVRARKGKHIHVRDLGDILRRVNSPHVVLTHVTHRTALRDAKHILRETLKSDEQQRVTFFMDRPRRPAPSHPQPD